MMKRIDLEKLYWNISKENCSKKGGGFEEYYAHLKRVFVQGIEICRKENSTQIVRHMPELSQELMEIFTKQMQQITMRTLIFEMGICNECRELNGVTSEEKYENFSKEFLQNLDYLKELYKEYPVMYEALLQAMEDWIQSITELLERFEQDRPELNRRFFVNAPSKAIQKICGGSSDSHRGGHRVYILELDNGDKLVYKPRSMKLDVAYQEFSQWTFQGLQIYYWWNMIWDREIYGWCQWVSESSCNSFEELSRYYERIGVLLCIAYLLGSEDLHYENLIAHGEYPVLVDLEMIIGSRGVETVIEKRDWSETEQIYWESVLQSGLLPLYAWNEAGEGVNVGAINGDGSQVLPIVMPVVVNAGTVDMHVEYRHPMMGEGKNQALLCGKFVEPYQFLNEIEKSFEKTYQFFLMNQEEVLKRLKQFQGIHVRYLIRDTQQYAMLLMTLYYPDFLVDKIQRQALWKWLDRKKMCEMNEVDCWVKEQEIKELVRGDIPYFYFDVGDGALYSGTGGKVENFFPVPISQCIAKRLVHMSKNDLERQKKLIRAALLMGTKKISMVKQGNWNIAFERYREENGVIAAEKIGDMLLEEAIWSDDKKDVGWISMIMAGYRERSYLIRPMKYYLYDGLAGVALFFTELVESSGKSKYREIMDVVRKKLFAYTDKMYWSKKSNTLLTGAYLGEGSIAFAYMMMYSINEMPIFLSYMEKQCQIVRRHLIDDVTYDILGGNAGAILIFLNAYQLTGEREYITWAREAGDYLIQSAVPYEVGIGWINPLIGRALTGFAHGGAGIMLALARLGHDTKDEKYHEAAYQAYCYEEYHYMKEWKDWADLRDFDYKERKKTEMAWCHGWGGIVMARLAAESYATGELKKELKKTRRFIQEKEISLFENGKICLCHGRCGNAALMYSMGLTEQAELLREQVIEEVCENNFRDKLEVQEYENFGLMGGIAGIGYSCLVGEERIMELLSVCSY